MNIFFYAAGGSDDGGHYLKKLLGLSGLKDITNLSGTSPFLSSLALKLRSGDLLIIFAGSRQELDTLVAFKNEFTDFRIILILAENNRNMIHHAHLLQPSFIVFQKEKIIKIEAVIKKMKRTDAA